MIGLVSYLGHAIAALLFGLLAVRESGLVRSDRQRWWLALAAAGTALWAVAAAALDPSDLMAGHAETLRNLGWLAFMFILLRRGEGTRRMWSLRAVYAALLFVAVAQAGFALSPWFMSIDEELAALLLQATFVLRMMFAIGALLLVHNLYTAAAAGARNGIGLPMAALAGLWAYDLNLYTLSYLADGWMAWLLAFRGAFVAVLAGVFMLAVRRNQGMSIRLSRTVAFRSLSLGIVAGYLLLTIMLSAVLDAIGVSGAAMVQMGSLTLAAIAAVIILPSPQLRARTRVLLSKHLFEHRYDYRAEWLRFTETLGRPGDEPAPLNMRVVKAIADITESPAGLLLVPEDAGLAARAGWNTDMLRVPAFLPGEALVALLTKGRILELDPLRAETGDLSEEAHAIPAWILADAHHWAIVPLIHFDTLAGAVLVARPPIARTLDWEDFDMLRIAGRQVASYLAEARGQEALSDAKQFDEFNRRFAFIMHDIKNLVSQLTLVTRNAERHADKPEFRADMIATLKSSTGKMNDLLERLSQHNTGRAEEPRSVVLGPLVTQLAAAKRVQHPVIVAGNMALCAMADPVRLEAALGHLLQNAIDASEPTEPVTIKIIQMSEETGIEISDKGCGMSLDFIRGQLFRPFASTKDGGFGIGAFEARTIVVAMGGRMTVDSEPGKGTRFMIWLPTPTRWHEALVA
jgi:putative PEP-CTERM system histidine kinase